MGHHGGCAGTPEGVALEQTGGNAHIPHGFEDNACNGIGCHSPALMLEVP